MASSDTLTVSALLEQIEAVAKNPPSDVVGDDSTRRKLRDAARNLSVALETPADSVHRIAHLHLETAMARIGIELHLFEILAGSEDTPLSSITLAEKTGVDLVLMRRFLRCWASFGMITEIKEDQYSASNVTRALVPAGMQAGIKFGFEFMSQGFSALPRFLRETKYQNPTDSTHTAWHLAYNTDEQPFAWLKNHPEYLGWFATWMTAFHEGQTPWLEIFPFEQELCNGLKPSTPVFVDVGGGVGHQCLALKQKFPNLPGRVILQDLEENIQAALVTEGVENTVHDFFTPQPIKGARAYYLRNILHDWPDEKCVQILRNLIPAMSKDSTILIDEMIIPSQGAHWRQTQMDLLMMANAAAVERTEKEWRALLESAGMKTKKIYRYTEELQDSIIVAVPK